MELTQHGIPLSPSHRGADGVADAHLTEPRASSRLDPALILVGQRSLLIAAQKKQAAGAVRCRHVDL